MTMISLMHWLSKIDLRGPLKLKPRKAMAVPGEVKCMHEAHKLFGALDWSDLFQARFPRQSLPMVVTSVTFERSGQPFLRIY